jgi:hypothetical protein
LVGGSVLLDIVVNLLSCGFLMLYQDMNLKSYMNPMYVAH